MNRSWAHRPRTGFTLFELLLVLAVLVLMAGLAWPALARSLAQQRLRQGARGVAVQLARARLRAIDRGTPWRLRYRPGTDQYGSGVDLRDWSPEQEPEAADGELPAAPPWSDEHLPEGVVFEAVEETSPTAGEATEAQVVFGPDGTTDDAELWLAGHGWHCRLVLRGLTGVVRVLPPERVEVLP